MNNFFHTRGFRGLLVVVVVMLSLLLITQRTDRSILADTINLVTSPMQSLSTAGRVAASDTLANLTNSPDALRAEIARLEEENQKYREQLIEFYDYQAKVTQYESVLEIKQQNQDFLMVPATVIGRDPNDLFYSFSIDQGYLVDIEKYDPVITGNGLVGWVSEVYATTSKVTTILHEHTQVGAIAKEKRESGVISCDIKLADQGVVKFGLLATNTQVAVGDIVTTTGLSGLFPKDLIIGEVTEVLHEEFDVSSYAMVSSYEDIKTVMDVFVITDFYGQGKITADDATAAERAAGSQKIEEPSSASESEGNE